MQLEKPISAAEFMTFAPSNLSISQSLNHSAPKKAAVGPRATNAHIEQQKTENGPKTACRMTVASGTCECGECEQRSAHTYSPYPSRIRSVWSPPMTFKFAPRWAGSLIGCVLMQTKRKISEKSPYLPQVEAPYGIERVRWVNNIPA